MAGFEEVGTGRNKRWRVHWRENGRKRSYTVKTLDDARRVAAQVAKAKIDGKTYRPGGVREIPSLEDGLRLYIESLTTSCAASTVWTYSHALGRFQDFLAEKRATSFSSLSKQLITDYAMWLREKNELNASTLRKRVQIASLAWSWLSEHDDWGEHVPRPRRIKLPAAPQRPTVAPRWHEMDACIAACRVDWHRRLAVVLRCTGLRVSQAMALRWDDVDLEHAWLTVATGKSASEKRGRVVPLAPPLLEELRAWEREGSFIIHTPGTDRPRSRQSIVRAWKRAGVRSDVWEQRPQHAFRKGFVSELKRAGADLEAVEYLVGHSLGLRGVYTDPDAMPLREAVAMVPPIGGSGVVLLRKPA